MGKYSTMLDDNVLQRLLSMVEQYALKKNLDVECYIDGMISPLLENKDLDLGAIIPKLVSYHEEWLAKN